jgi:hypothetical protein
MANLENLGEFDKHFRRAANDINTLSATRGGKKDVWTHEQEVQFSQLLGAVRHMYEAVESLVHNNR